MKRRPEELSAFRGGEKRLEGLVQRPREAMVQDRWGGGHVQVALDRLVAIAVVRHLLDVLPGDRGKRHGAHIIAPGGSRLQIRPHNRPDSQPALNLRLRSLVRLMRGSGTVAGIVRRAEDVLLSTIRLASYRRPYGGGGQPGWPRRGAPVDRPGLRYMKVPARSAARAGQPRAGVDRNSRARWPPRLR